MTILVTGATGTVGRHVLHTLRARGADARAHDRAAAWPGQLAGVDRMFLACGNVPEQVDFECAAIDAAAAAGVTRIVKLSAPDPSPDSPVVFERWHAAIEQHLENSGVPAVRLRPRTFMTNLLAFAPAIAATGTVFAPAADARIAFIDPRDVAAVAAECLTGPSHEGRTYTLTGPDPITYTDIAAALSRATGRTVGYVPVSDEDARAAMVAGGLPEPIADAIVSVFAVQRTGRMAATTPTVRRLLGREPRSIDDFARDHAVAFTAGPVPSNASS
jgi:uncharacterized protein YbjT (DUF2867 family)